VFDGTNLGIGASPAQTLHVKTSTSSTPITLGVLSNATGLPALSFNGAYASTTMAGIYGNGAAASSLYYEVPSGQNHYFGIADVTKMTLDSLGNLGLGVAPVGNAGNGNSIEISYGGAIHADAGNPAMSIASSAYRFDNDWKYKNGSFAPTRYTQGSGSHSWFTASIGTTGNVISFAQVMTLDAGGNLLVGGTAARGTTAGTAHLDLFNGTAPAGTLTNGISLYSDSGDLKFMNAAGDAFDVGYRNIPQNSQSAAYTLVLADAGKHIFHPVGDNNARTFTIPANSSVAYPVGTAITFINMAAANVTIAITTDTMYLSSAGTTGSRTLAQYGSATAIKITSTNWLISGSGLT
jgi:hypothetical protein